MNDEISYAYFDNDGKLQGPFDKNCMQTWYKDGYLCGDLKVIVLKTVAKVTMNELTKQNGKEKPFEWKISNKETQTLSINSESPESTTQSTLAAIRTSQLFESTKDSMKLVMNPEERINALKKLAESVEVSNSVPIAMYYDEMIKLNCNAMNLIENSDYENAFVLLARFCWLSMSKIRDHIGYAFFESEKKRMVINLYPSTVTIAEKIKALLMKRFEDEANQFNRMVGSIKKLNLGDASVSIKTGRSAEALQPKTEESGKVLKVDKSVGTMPFAEVKPNVSTIPFNSVFGVAVPISTNPIPTPTIKPANQKAQIVIVNQKQLIEQNKKFRIPFLNGVKITTCSDRLKSTELTIKVAELRTNLENLTSNQRLELFKIMESEFKMPKQLKCGRCYISNNSIDSIIRHALSEEHIRKVVEANLCFFQSDYTRINQIIKFVKK